MGAAYNYHFLSIKTFRCACAAALACKIVCSISPNKNLVTGPDSYLSSFLSKSCHPTITKLLIRNCSEPHVNSNNMNNSLRFFWEVNILGNVAKIRTNPIILQSWKNYSTNIYPRLAYIKFKFQDFPRG